VGGWETDGLTGCRGGGIVAAWGSDRPSRSLHCLYLGFGRLPRASEFERERVQVEGSA